MSGPEDIRSNMDLHLKVQETMTDMQKRMNRVESHTDLLQASFLRLEQDARRQSDHVRARLDELEERQARHQEDTNVMIEGALIVGRQNTDSIASLADLQAYSAEITARAKSDRWWAEGWQRLSDAKGKILGLATTAGAIASLWHYWDSLTAWLKNGGNG